jgi:uncharacterized protein GlcG (DUF336 family)
MDYSYARGFVFAAAVLCFSPPAFADTVCPVTHDQLVAALKANVKASGGPSNGGLDNNEWAAVVNRDGIVCAIAFSGAKADDQWPGSRAIAAEKANTANGLSLKTFAMSTANLYASVQPGGPLFGLALSNPANPAVLYTGPGGSFGTDHDPMLGNVAGGVIVFGGGLALYNKGGIVGGLGASGDTSCADHNIAWRMRIALKLNNVPAGPNPNTKNDGIIYDIGPNGKSASGYGHPTCGGKEADITATLQAGTTPQ